MASTTAHPPPTSVNKARCRPLHLPAVFATRPVPATSSAGCFCCKACAGRIICRLFLLQGLCRPLHLPAVFTTRPVPVSFTTGPFCHNGLVLPCLVCLPLPWPHACCPWSCICPIFVHCHARQDHRACCRDCPVGSRITGLHWRPVHRVFHPSIHCLCLLAPGSSRVLQGLPCRQPHQGTALATCAPLVFPALISKGEAQDCV